MTTDPQPAADEVTERLMHLRAMLADLDRYIDKRAEEKAAPLIAAAEERIREPLGEALFEARRWHDAFDERGRRIETLERHRKASDEARERLAAALGTHPGALPLSYFVRMAETVLAEAQMKESEHAQD